MPERKPKLKPCPWCGAEPIVSRSDMWEIRGKRMWRVQCDNVACRMTADTGWLGSKRASIAAWNRRKEIPDART